MGGLEIKRACCIPDWLMCDAGEYVSHKMMTCEVVFFCGRVQDL